MRSTIMRMTTLGAAVAAVCLLTAGPGAAQETKTPAVKKEAPTAKIGEAAPEFKLPDVDGEMHALSDFRGQTVVLQWFNPDCPFVVNCYRGKAMKQTMTALEEMGEDDYVPLLVNSTAIKPAEYITSSSTSFLKEYKT